MSKIYYDHLIDFSELEKALKETISEPNEREEFWQLVDEIIHQKVMVFILDMLPEEYHEEFIERVTSSPYDHTHLEFLKERIKDDVEVLLGDLFSELQRELLGEL